MSNELSVNESNFNDEVLKSDKPVLIDFWAPWCGPCKMIAPLIEEISNEYSTKLKVVKCDVDDNPDIASKYDITGIPTLVLIKSGKESTRLTGAASKDKIIQMFADKIQ